MVTEQQLLIPRETILSAIRSLPYSSYTRVILAADEKKSKKRQKEKRVHKFEEFVTVENYQGVSEFLQRLIQQMVDDIDAAAKSPEKKFTNGAILSFDFSNIKIAESDDASDIKNALITNFSNRLSKLADKFNGKDPDEAARKELLRMLNTSIFEKSKESEENDSPVFDLIMDDNISKAINVILSKESIKAELTGDFKKLAAKFGVQRDRDDTSIAEEDMKHATEIIENFLITNLCNTTINVKPYTSIIEDLVKNNNNILSRKIDEWYQQVVSGHENEDNLGININSLEDKKDSDNTDIRSIAELVRTIPAFSKKDLDLGVFSGRFKLVIVMLASLKNVNSSSDEGMLSDINKQFRQRGLDSKTFSEYLDKMYDSIVGETDGIQNKYLPDESGNKKFSKDDMTIQQEQDEERHEEARKADTEGKSTLIIDDNTARSIREEQQAKEQVKKDQENSIQSGKYDRTGITNPVVLKIIDELEKMAADKNPRETIDYNKMDLFYRLAKALGILVNISAKISNMKLGTEDIEQDGTDLYNYKKGSYGQLLAVDYKTLENYLKDGTQQTYIDSLGSSQLINEVAADLYDTSKGAIKSIVLGILKDQLHSAYQRLQEMIQNMKAPVDNSFDKLYESCIVNGIDDEFLQFMYMNFSKTLAGRDNLLGKCVDAIAGTPLGNLTYKLLKNTVKSFWYFTIHGGADTFYRGVDIAKAYPMQFLNSRYLTDDDIRKIYTRIRYYPDIKKAMDRLAKIVDPNRESYTYKSSGKQPDMEALRNGTAKKASEQKAEEKPTEEQQKNGEEQAPKSGATSSVLTRAKSAILAAENENKKPPEDDKTREKPTDKSSEDSGDKNQGEKLDAITESNMDTLTGRYASGKTWKPGRVLFTQIEKKFITEANLPVDKFQDLLDLLDVKYVSAEVDKKLNRNKIVLLTEDGFAKIKETLNGNIASVYNVMPKNTDAGEPELNESQQQEFNDQLNGKIDQLQASAKELDEVFSCGTDIKDPEKFRELMEFIEGTVVLVLNQESIAAAQKNIETENITDDLGSLQNTLNNLRSREKELDAKSKAEIHDEEGQNLITGNPNNKAIDNLKIMKAGIIADYDKAKQFIGDYANYFKYYEVQNGTIKPMATKDNGEEDHNLKRSKDDKNIMDKIVPAESKDSYEKASKNLLQSMQDMFNLFGDRQIIDIMAKLTHKALPLFRYTKIKRGALLPFLKKLATLRRLIQEYEPLQAWYIFKNSLPLTSLHATDYTKDLPTQYLAMLVTIVATGDAKFADDYKQKETDWSMAMAAVNRFTKNMTQNSPFNSPGNTNVNATTAAQQLAENMAKANAGQAAGTV